ncbi:MAG TPA: glucose 1-dehydrogenase [Sedimentisphaerales bacterium]|nr:glucose 1-dehydrogenase [Sedimentisphaerales bacterium]
MVYYVGMENDRFDLTGKRALVTGGGRGIGLAIAKGLAEHGADVALVARTQEQLDEACAGIRADTGRKAVSFPYDLANLDGLEALFDNVVEQAGAVDILVNCAGTTARGASEDVNLADWERVQNVNLKSVLVLSQAFCRDRKQAGTGGSIVNIGSLMCAGARPTTAAYAASKGGLLMLTKTLAVEWAKYGINVNAIGPGYIATELTASLRADEEFNKWVLSKTPAGRWGRPEDLVGAAVLLASDAGAFITGQIIYVDGGWLALL